MNPHVRNHHHAENGGNLFSHFCTKSPLTLTFDLEKNHCHVKNHHVPNNRSVNYTQGKKKKKKERKGIDVVYLFCKFSTNILYGV